MMSKTKLLGIPTGLTDLDNMISGLQKSKFYIIGSRPTMGKSTLGYNIAKNTAAAASAQKPVLIFSLAMCHDDIVIKGYLDHAHYIEKNSGGLRKLESMPIYLDDESELSPIDIASRARKLYREHNGLSMILIDYLQLMKIPGYGPLQRTQEISEISRLLKTLAKELEVPIVLLSQLNRTADDREDKRPLLSDIRESRSIEQDADAVIFIYRDEVYYRNIEDNKNLAEIIVRKQIDGPIGTVHVKFDKESLVFRDIICTAKLP